MAKLKRKYRTLRATLPNAGIEAQYRKQILGITRWMLDERFIPKADSENLPWVLERYANYLRGADITEHFQREAERIAKTFVNRAANYTKSALLTALESAGYAPSTLESLRRLPAALDNIKSAVYRENVSLIRNIPEQTAQRIERMVNDSIVKGRDLGGMVQELKDIPGMTLRRAKNIARDQNNKATEDMALVRAQAMGITHGIWMHRSGGKTFRESHVAMSGERFLLSEGLYDMNEGRNVFPAELVNCRCTYMPVLPDLE